MRYKSGHDKRGRPLPKCKACGNVSIIDRGVRKDYLNKDGLHTACAKGAVIIGDKAVRPDDN